MAILTREQILARKVGHELVPIGDDGEVEVRGLTRGEAAEIGALEDNLEREVQTLALGLVQPKLSAEDVQAWMGNDDYGTMRPALEKIMALSGMAPGQGKEDTKSLPG